MKRIIFLTLLVLITYTGQNPRSQQLTAQQQEVMRLYQEAQNEIKAGTSTKTKSGGFLNVFSPVGLVKAYGILINGAINSSQKKKAINIYEKLIPLSEKAFGPENPQTVIFINDLGMLYETENEFGKAELLYKRILTTREKTLGPNHPDVAETLNNLGRLYLTIGRFSNAEPLLKRAIEIREKSLGPDSPLVAESLLNLGNLYAQLADYDRAEKMFNRSLSILEKSPDADKTVMAQALTNIAALYFEQNEYSRAEPLVKKAIQIIQEKDSGATAFDAYRAYMMFFLIGHANGHSAKSLNTGMKVVQLKESAGLGTGWAPESPEVISWMNQLMEFVLLTKPLIVYENPFYGMKAYAGFSLGRQLKNGEEELGPDHPAIASILNNSALYEVRKKNYRGAIPNSKRAMEIIYKSISDVFVIASENLKLKFLAKNELYRDVLFSGILGSKQKQEDTMAGFMWELRLKGMVLESMIGEREVVKKGLSPELKTAYKELQQVRQELASLYVKGPSIGDDSYIKNMTELEARKDELEAKISRGSSAFKESREMLYVTPDAVCAKMQKGSALIEYVEFKNYGEKGFHDWMAAFVLEEGKCATPTMVNLGPADKIEAAVKAWREELQAFPTSKIKEADARNKLDEKGRALAELVWKPIVKVLQASPLQAKSVVYISPDGPIHLMPMGALPDDGGSYLIEKINIGYVSSGKDFMRSHKAGMRKGSLLVGGVDFNLGAVPQAPTRVALATVGTRGMCGKLDELKWNILPGTVTEVDSISASFGKNKIPVTLLKGPDGQEAKVRNGFGNARYIHLATHGFFLGDECGLAGDVRGIGGVRPGTQNESAAAPIKTTSVRRENPLLLSGLALAGANNSWRGGAGGGGNDGYLLAMEVANLDLEGVELVTLSACQTGLGEIKRGEGVFGLKRSFMIAGAEALIMSLWSVPDKETKELMVDFYNRILSGNPKRESFRQTQLKMMKSGPGGSYRHPFYWAAFQYIGVN